MQVISIEIAETSKSFVVVGLGDDGKIYFWSPDEEKWLIYSTK